MARQQNTVAKRLREMAKKRKAEDKRVQRRKNKERIDTPPLTPGFASEDPGHALESEPKPVIPS
jgi:hypothetical protein